jgi:RNA polymerase sporulation-specific sigma factor
MYIRKLSARKGEVSLDEPINLDSDGNEMRLSDILGTDDDVVTGHLEEETDKMLLWQALTELPDREREIVIMRYGLQGRKELTQKEVAEKLGISQSYISRLEKRIMQKMRKHILSKTACA